MSFRVISLALLLALPVTVCAQGGTVHDVMSTAVRAYRDLQYDVAVNLLRHVLLAPPLAAQLDNTERAKALIYLGAAEQYAGRGDSAIAVFRRLVALAPGQRPDTLIFPPEIIWLYDEVRRTTVVAVEPPPAPPPPAAALPQPAQTAQTARSEARKP